MRFGNRKVLGIALIIAVVAVALFGYFIINSSGPSTSGYSVLWRQVSVHGLDNFGTATYMDGVLYAPSKGDNSLYALNASDGKVLWRRAVRQCDASPCIDGGVIYVGECSGPNGEVTESPEAIALDRNTGQEIWHFVEPSGIPWVGSPVVHDEFVYYTTLGRGVYALNRSNGNPIWHQDVGKIVCSVAYHEGVVFTSVNDPPGQYALNATTGEYVWHVNYGSSWDSSPVVNEGTVIQTVRNTTTSVLTTYVLNETSGEVVKKFEGKGGCSTPLVHNGVIVIPSRNCQLWAFNLTTGAEKWHTPELTSGNLELENPTLSYCSPAEAEGTIYYQSLSGRFCMINETDGSIRWSNELGGLGFGSPSIGDGCVFVTNDSALYAFKVGSFAGGWPMFCRNGLHESYVGY